MTNGHCSDLNILNFFKIMPDIIIAIIPIIYALIATIGEPPKIAPQINAINGTLAPQGIKEVVIMVILLSETLSMVLDAIMPGTEQPVPTRIGINDLPDSPNFLNSLSKTKAILDI